MMIEVFTHTKILDEGDWELILDEEDEEDDR
jgi:hypothetical protein